MRNSLRSGFFGDQGHLWPVLILGAVILLFGCQSREPQLSPGAVTFKKEMKNCLDNLAANLMEPVAKKDTAAITAALEKAESPAVKLCRLCPFEVAVLKPSGETLAVYPSKGDGKAKNFSSYALIKKAISSKRIQQQRFFLPDGSKLYLVCAPLIRQDTLIGLVAIAISSKDAEQRWDLKEKEFLALDFNT
jgi:Sec-independent protein translocase protein TatA